jgi:hypothetical protein
MRRLVLAAAMAMSAVACNQNPVSPDVPVEVRKARPAPTPARICEVQRLAVYSLMLRIQYSTSGALRTTLMGQLQLAYDALNPLACRPADAIASLEQFVATVTANSPPNSNAISRLTATLLIAQANWIISNLRPLAV